MSNGSEKHSVQKTNRILFWLDIEFFHFGIAKYLQDNYNCELFAIIEANKNQRKFFEKQQFVKFKKAMYYTASLSKYEKPNIDYLSSFEKKYNINLLNLIYCERFFYKYNRFYKFKYDEILSLIQQECRFFEETLDSIRLGDMFPDYKDFLKE